MPPTPPSFDAARAAHAAGTVAEWLEVLWGRGQDGTTLGSLPPSQLRALTVVEERAGANLRTLSDALGSRPPSVSRLCDRLEAGGLLERTPSATSGREVELRLTSRGRTALHDIRALRRHEVTEVLQTMSAAQLAALAEGLEAFQDAARSRVGLEQPSATIGRGEADTA
ncbi:MarR family transcriptional regulator [Streptomyces sp. SPB162]|uniref:MarR family winged helix-turn-helix transcriptional regulator n=1 Tax=Streptomyces sp. SPB162 TaxID=2940560 RepID=UPI0024052A49|nr:MarR family transcriptional regulator [Streptomyces sp. SPB162]MDF9810775.1 DNA-binding MarR family transcriptional regulator [Streptomyces sp. SPB162]